MRPARSPRVSRTCLIAVIGIHRLRHEVSRHSAPDFGTPGVAQRQAVTEFLNGGDWKRGSVFPISGPNVFIVDVHTMVADLQQDDPILH
jgi:hypothetical protein